MRHHFRVVTILVVCLIAYGVLLVRFTGSISRAIVLCLEASA